MSKLKNNRYILVTHFLIYSASQALRDYLVHAKVTNLLYISHPLPQIDANKNEHSFAKSYIFGKSGTEKEVRYEFSGLFFSVLSHFFLTLYWSLKLSTEVDVFIGIDNVNALAGIILKRLGRVKKVVYYTIDYFPTRYESKLLNGIYHVLDKLCVAQADETWNVSKEMVLAREIHNEMRGKRYMRQFTVPIGVWFNNAPRKSYSSKRILTLVFVGHLVKHMGVDLVLRSLPALAKKFPEIKFDVIGGGEELENLKSLSKELGIEKLVMFYGWIKDRSEVERLVSNGGIGVATFNTDILDSKVKNADPAKIKDYMLLGLPVITTNAIKNWQELRDRRCAIITEYSEKDFIASISNLLQGGSTYKEYRANVLAYIKQFDYETIFSKNLERIISK